MVWIKLPKSGKPMFLHGAVPKGLAEIPDPTKPAEPKPVPKAPAKEHKA